MKILYLFLLLALPSVIFAQSNYYKGYVIKNDGDTLKGFINYHEWDQSPKTIDFRVNKDDKQTLLFSPKTIKGFEITEMETYISYAGIISMNKMKLDDLPNKLDTSKRQDTIFLRPLATGRYLTLYYNNDEIKTRFFVAETDNNPVELNYYQYYADEGTVTERPVFKGQLILYINKFNSGNAQLIKKAGYTSYSPTDLENLINEINGGKSEGNINHIAKSKKPNVRFFTGIGWITTMNKFSGGSPNFFATAQSPKIELGFDILFNPNVQQLVMRLDLAYSYNKPRFNIPVIVSSTPTNLLYTFNQYTTSITPQLLFNFYNKDNFKIYIDGGIGINFSSYNNSRYIIQKGTLFAAPPELESYWANVPLQAGIIINKKLEVAFTYATYAPFTKYLNSAVSSQSMSLGVKYLFDRR